MASSRMSSGKSAGQSTLAYSKDKLEMLREWFRSLGAELKQLEVGDKVEIHKLTPRKAFLTGFFSSSDIY